MKTTPWWAEDGAPPPIPATEALPAAADVVVGSGYTGLHAALQVMARFDRGISTRNRPVQPDGDSQRR